MLYFILSGFLRHFHRWVTVTDTIIKLNEVRSAICFSFPSKETDCVHSLLSHLKAAQNDTSKPQADSHETRQGAPVLRSGQHHLLTPHSTPPSITGPPPTKQDGGAGARSRARRGAPAAFRRRYGTAGRNRRIRRYPRRPALVPPPLAVAKPLKQPKFSFNPIGAAVAFN